MLGPAAWACGGPTISRWDQWRSPPTSTAASSSYSDRIPTWTATSGAAVATGQPTVGQLEFQKLARAMCFRPKSRPVASPDTLVSSEDEKEDVEIVKESARSPAAL